MRRKEKLQEKSWKSKRNPRKEKMREKNPGRGKGKAGKGRREKKKKKTLWKNPGRGMRKGMRREEFGKAAAQGLLGFQS